MITVNRNIILDSGVRRGPKYIFLSSIDLPKYLMEISASLNDFCIRWCKRENVEPDVLKE